MNHQTAIDNIGNTVHVSDGTPQPPARFNRKLATWEQHNYSGKLTEVKPYHDKPGHYAAIQTLNSPIVVVNIITDISRIDG